MSSVDRIISELWRGVAFILHEAALQTFYRHLYYNVGLIIVILSTISIIIVLTKIISDIWEHHDNESDETRN